MYARVSLNWGTRRLLFGALARSANSSGISPAMAKPTAATNTSRSACMACASKLAAPLPAIAPSTLPAPMKPYRRLACVIVKRSATRSQKCASTNVASRPDQTYRAYNPHAPMRWPSAKKPSVINAAVKVTVDSAWRELRRWVARAFNFARPTDSRAMAKNIQGKWEAAMRERNSASRAVSSKAWLAIKANSVRKAAQVSRRSPLRMAKKLTRPAYHGSQAGKTGREIARGAADNLGIPALFAPVPGG